MSLLILTVVVSAVAAAPKPEAGPTPEVVFDCRNTKGEAFSVTRDEQGRVLRETVIPNPDRSVVITRAGAVIAVQLDGETPLAARDLSVDSSNVFLTFRLKERPEAFQVSRRPDRPIQVAHRLWDAQTRTETIRSLDTCSVAKPGLFPATRTVRPGGP